MTTEQLAPKWAGQFDSFVKWINHANIWLQSPSQQPAVCIDAKGRRCSTGKDFMRARDEGAFPVRYFWEFEVSAPGECGSVPDGFTIVPIYATPDIRAALCEVLRRHGNGKTQIVQDVWDELLSAANEDVPCASLGMQPANNQPNSDHVAVTSAEPESSLTTDQIVDTALSYGHPVEELFVGFFKRELVTYVRRLEKISRENKSGMSSLVGRPNEQNVVQTEQPSLSDEQVWDIYVKATNAVMNTGGRTFAIALTRAILAQRQDSDKDAAFPLYLTRSELDIVWAEFRASVSNGGKDPDYIIVRDKADKLRAAIANGAPK